MDKKDRALNILVQVHNSYAKKNLVISRNETMDNYLDLRVLQPLQYRKEAVELNNYYKSKDSALFLCFQKKKKAIMK